MSDSAVTAMATLKHKDRETLFDVVDIITSQLGLEIWQEVWSYDKETRKWKVILNG